MTSVLRASFTLCLAAALMAGRANAAVGETELVSLHFAPPVRLQYVHPFGVSADGRFVAFKGDNDSLAPGDANGFEDCLVRDRLWDRTLIASAAVDAGPANGDTVCDGLTPDGRYVLMHSQASNLVARDTNGTGDAFVRDLATGVTERVSVIGSGGQLPGASGAGSISDDGRTVVFRYSGGLIVRDRVTQQAKFIDAGIVTASPLLSPDGRYVVYGESGRLQLIDLQSGDHERIDVSSAGAGGLVADAAPRGISDGGRYVLFTSSSANLAAGDLDLVADVFLRDRVAGTTERVSVRADGFEWPAAITQASMSNDGRFVAWSAYDGRLAETPNVREIFLLDRTIDTVKRVNRNSDDSLANRSSVLPVLSADGRFVAFASYATNLSPLDTDNVEMDTFVRELSLAGSGRFDVDATELSFGSVAVGTQSATKVLTVTNSSDAAVVLIWIGLTGPGSDQFSRVRYCPKTLDPGKSCTVDVTFAPTVAGAASAFLVVSTGETTQKAFVTLSGTGL